MTIVIAYENSSKVCLGSDSCAVGAGAKIEIGTKIISKQNYYIGFSDSFRVADIIRESKTIPYNIDSREDIKTLRDTIRADLIKYMGASSADSEEEESHPLSILIACKLGAYEIQADYAILRPKARFCAIGAGRDFALGAMETHKLYDSDPEIVVKETLKTTMKYCTETGGQRYVVTIHKK